MTDVWILIRKDRVGTYENEKIIKYIADHDLQNFRILDPRLLLVRQVAGSREYLYNDGELIKLRTPKKVFTKLGCSLNSYEENILSNLEQDGVYLLNSLVGLEQSSDKEKTAILMSGAGIPTIDSVYLNGGNSAGIQDIVEGYPVILKSKKGSLGTGIYKIENEQELKNMLEQIKLIDSDYEFLLQRYIPEGSVDYRVVMFNGKIKYVVKRVAKPGEFRANVALGSSTELLEEYDEKLVRISQKIYEAIGLGIMGIDLFLVDGEYIVCEVNSNPGYIAYDKITGKEFTEELMEFLE